jgi:hypothetical protein
MERSLQMCELVVAPKEKIRKPGGRLKGALQKDVWFEAVVGLVGAQKRRRP